MSRTRHHNPELSARFEAEAALADLTPTDIASIERQLASAISLVRTGSRALVGHATLEYTDADLAWFRAPVRGVRVRQ